MTLGFIAALFLVVAASGLDDHLFLLQTSMSVESKKVQAKADSASSFGEALSTCPSMSDVDMDGVSCTSAANGVHIKSVQTQTQSKADIEEEAPLVVEDESTAAAVEADDVTYTSILRCVLNLITLVVFADILRRSFSKSIGEASAAVVVADVTVSSLLRAAEKNDVVAVTAMLEQGLSCYAEDDLGRTALHAAAKGGAAVVVGLLLEKGAKVDVLDSWDETPLHHAARAGKIDMCKLLLSRGAKIDALNGQDWTPLVAAASAGKKAVCEWLLVHGATQDDLTESFLPPMLQQLLKREEEPEEPSFQSLEAKQEADLLRRVMEPKPEWEVESLPQWVDA